MCISPPLLTHALGSNDDECYPNTLSAPQAEVDANRVAVLLNIAAVAVEKAEFRTAVQLCSRALALEPDSKKALLRRAKAHIGRHEPQVPALSD